MRPVATEQNTFRYPLNALFGAPANVRLLRLLADGVTGPIGAAEAGDKTGLSPAGARRALQKLVDTGYVICTGSGRAQQYQLRDEDALVVAIRTLFTAERHRHQQFERAVREALKPLTELRAAWFTPPSTHNVIHLTAYSDARSIAHLGEQIRQRIGKIERDFEVTLEVHTVTRAELESMPDEERQMLVGYVKTSDTGIAATHDERDQRAAAISAVIAELVETDAGLVKRALKHIEFVLLDDAGTATHTLKEWQAILHEYSKPRLKDFLVSDAPRAVRLRQSSPFFAVLTDSQRDHVYDAIGETT